MDQQTTAGLFLPYGYGRGYPTLNKQLTPAAGAASVLAVPGSRNFRMLSVSGQLVTSAVAGNRGLFLEFLDADGSVYCHVPSGAAVAASTTTQFTFAGRGRNTNVGADTSLVISLVELIVPVGHKIRVSWSGLQAGDALASMFWYYDEFLIGGDGYEPGTATAREPHLNP